MENEHRFAHVSRSDQKKPRASIMQRVKSSQYEATQIYEQIAQMRMLSKEPQTAGILGSDASPSE